MCKLMGPILERSTSGPAKSCKVMLQCREVAISMIDCKNKFRYCTRHIPSFAGCCVLGIIVIVLSQLWMTSIDFYIKIWQQFLFEENLVTNSHEILASSKGISNQIGSQHCFERMDWALRSTLHACRRRCCTLQAALHCCQSY